MQLLVTELEGDADDENIKIAYRRLAKFYHPDGSFYYFHCYTFIDFTYIRDLVSAMSVAGRWILSC